MAYSVMAVRRPWITFERSGVTAIELLPVQQHLAESFLVRRHLTNYMGLQPGWEPVTSTVPPGPWEIVTPTAPQPTSSPTARAAAVVLHPALRWDWVSPVWDDSR